ncbi:MAG: helix-turn-helix transcriptional regulator [Flavobacteriales bacterium]|nr:helix-turn-helix transcriptional regulator [Flavobacteriales bacterium]
MVPEHKVLKYKGQVVFEKITTPYIPRVPKLFQNNEACFMFINKGEFSVRTPDQFISLKKGKGLLAKCFDYFFETNQAQRASSDHIEILAVLLYPSMVEELFQFDLSLSELTVNFNVKQIKIDSLLNNYKESINLLLDNPELADEAIIKTKLIEFILLIGKTQNAPSLLDFLSAMFRTNSTEFKTTVNNNLYSSLSIDEFAKLCGMSVSSFKRKFNETFQESPKKYFGKMKLQKASKMLATGNLRISEIAYDCGYESISTFNRSFKTHFGQSPSEYRLSQTA